MREKGMSFLVARREEEGRGGSLAIINPETIYFFFFHLPLCLFIYCCGALSHNPGGGCAPLTSPPKYAPEMNIQCMPRKGLGILD